MAKGLFISLDGIDGAGKTTQGRLLADWLREQGRTVVVCRDPGGTPVGDQIRALLLDRHSEMNVWCEAFLYMASRAQLVQQVVRPAVDQGAVVLADRFLLANVAYQGHGGGLDPQRLWQLGELATQGIMPDVVLVLDLAVKNALQRKDGPRDRMESKGVEFLQRVRAGFLAEAHQRPEQIRVVDAGASVELVQRAIREEVGRVLDSHASA